eukprot:GHVP01025029.1.p2 GENE.GHVP01025029.1~~GHVP01025029.1.p2  ORF type:complete len:134 (-),score=36.60 GHVP01025029.1:222-623(-)
MTYKANAKKIDDFLFKKFELLKEQQKQKKSPSPEFAFSTGTESNELRIHEGLLDNFCLDVLRAYVSTEAMEKLESTYRTSEEIPKLSETQISDSSKRKSIDVPKRSSSAGPKRKVGGVPKNGQTLHSFFAKKS